MTLSEIIVATWKNAQQAIAVAIMLSIMTPSFASAKESNSISQPENKESYVSVGDMLVKMTLRESLPNAFGGADVFGRKRDRGFIEIRYMGLSEDGRAIFRRRSVDIYSNETTMSRSGMRTGSATITPNGDGVNISTFSVGATRATVEALPPDTIEFVLDLKKNKVITLEDRAIEILEADSGGVKFVIRKR
jgi:hypothetical protein